MRPFAVLAAAALTACCEFSGPRWHGRKSDHFDGERFHNQLPGAAPGFWTIVEWRLHRHQGPWPDFVDAPPAPAPPRRVDGLRITLVNHSTVLIQLGGFNVLTDPIWEDIAGPLSYLGRRRHRTPGLRLEDLPPIDVVLISHDHYDHLDVGTLGKIARKDHPRIVAGLGMAALLAQNDIHGVTDLDWWQWVAPRPGLKIHAVPARHGCRRGPCDDDARLWVGFVISTRQGDVYFAGDTGYGPHLQAIADRFGPPLVALLPIAPGIPRPLFAAVHMDAHEAVLAAKLLKARTNIPIHFGTFSQGDEGDGDAERKLRAEMDRTWVVLHNGDAFTNSPAAGGS